MEDCAANLKHAGPRQLARLLAVDPAETEDWGPEELGAMLRHQLEARLSVDLAVAASGLAAAPGEGTPALETRSGSWGTYADLFHGAEPPIQLLWLVKDFAKANCCHPASALPNDIATLLYLMSIVAARLHARERISQLTDEELRGGVQWVLGQTWVDERTRGLFVEALRALRSSEGEVAQAAS